MTAFTLGEATALALGRMRPPFPGHRLGLVTGNGGTPVRRDSVEAGTFEERFFRPPARGETDRLLRIARAALDAGRRLRRTARAEGRALTPAERPLAVLTAGAVRVFEEICTLARLNGGRVFPSYDHLARATALGRATVARSLVLLEAAGLLVRQRRFRRVEGEGPGPRYRQTSNVYRPTLPGRLMALLPRWLRSAPVPIDALEHAAEHRRDHAAMLASLSCHDLAVARTGGALGAALARLGARIDRVDAGTTRESQNDPGSLHE